MNTALRLIRTLRWLVLATGLSMLPFARAFPPAPHQIVFGLVRDEQGNPVNAAGATVLLEVGGKILAKGIIAPTGEPGVNYRLRIPLDSGTKADLYTPSALLPTVPFRIRVKIGATTYLPIEMTGASTLVTKPGNLSRVDLTLGVDSDGDGLPDAWELNLIRALGKPGLTIADIRPGDDADGDGLTNLQEYLAGTYAFDPQDGFALTLKGLGNGSAQLEFTVIRGRAYTIEGALAPQGPWTQIPFVIPADGASAPARNSYSATDVRILKVTTSPATEPATVPRFFRLMVH